MRPVSIAAFAVLAGLLVPSVAVACLWDYDTIKMERTRFPGILELITGKFLRHSPEFYQWRITNRLKRLEADPTNVELLDDLAVAYDKTGQHDKAIETAQKIEKLRPGRYETAANLGTFYLHSGKTTEGIPHIDRALKINPDAHFGREKYQKLLAEYVIKQRKGGPLTLPLANIKLSEGAKKNEINPYDHTVTETFAEFLKPKDADKATSLEQQEIDAAVKGITGMMKFGKYDSPVLLEALGTVLIHREFDSQNDAKQLAARAFLKASYEVPEGPARVSYRRMAAGALGRQKLRTQTQDDKDVLDRIEADLQKELQEARAWYAELRERELSWIRDGKNPEVEFDKLYDTEPEVSGLGAEEPMIPEERVRFFLIGVGAGLALIVFICVTVVAVVIYLVRKNRI